jgi:hypothetical protein
MKMSLVKRWLIKALVEHIEEKAPAPVRTVEGDHRTGRTVSYIGPAIWGAGVMS